MSLIVDRHADSSPIGRGKLMTGSRSEGSCDDAEQWLETLACPFAMFAAQ